MRYLKWILAAAASATGLAVLRSSHQAYGRWYNLIEMGDRSGAEVHEVELWFTVPLALVLIVVSAFMAGRWSAKRSDD